MGAPRFGDISKARTLVSSSRCTRTGRTDTSATRPDASARSLLHAGVAYDLLPMRGVLLHLRREFRRSHRHRVEEGCVQHLAACRVSGQIADVAVELVDNLRRRARW